MNRIKSWISGRLSPINLLSLALVLATMNIVAQGVAGAALELEAKLLSNMALTGTLIGWTLALLPMAGWLASLSTILIATLVVFFSVGAIGPAVSSLLHSLAELGISIWWWIINHQIPDWTPLTQSLEELFIPIRELLIHESNWLLAWVKGEPFFDPLAAALTWSLALWAVAAWAGWAVHRRKQPLPAVIPAGVLLSITLGFTGSKSTPLLWLLGTSLPVIAIVSQEVRQSRWRKTGTYFPTTIWHNLALWATVLSLALVATAGLTQFVSLKKLVLFAQSITMEQAAQREQAAESLGLEHQPLQQSVLEGALEIARSPNLPRIHLLGSGQEPTKRELMLIHVSAPTISQLHLNGRTVVPRYYWRSNTYDQYTGHGWTTGQTEPVTYEADQPVRSIDLSGHQLVRQEMLFVAEQMQPVYRAGTLVTTDQDFTVEWRSPDDAFGAFFTTPTKMSQVDSLIPTMSETELRTSDSDYPDWVRARYLTLPDSVPERVLALADELTANFPTPYDKARAIESYLREFPYTLDLPTPPSDQDIVDYFIFDLQKGYCDYYATAMAVLSRAAGIPARLVIGYSSGRYDVDIEAYVVTDAQAHSWVEIYFPDYGWVEFEPTAGHPIRERWAASEGVEPAADESMSEQEDLNQSGVDLESAGQKYSWLSLVLASLSVLVLGSATTLLIGRWRLLRLSTAGVATKIFRQIQRHSIRLRAPTYNGDTAYELSEALIDCVTPVDRKTRWQRALAPAGDEVRFLTENYVQISYSPHTLGEVAKLEIIRTWRRLRWRLWLVWIRARLQRRGWIK